MNASCTYPWLNTHWRTLTDSMQQQRLPHALLLTGAAGIGKLDFATAFAELLLGETESDKQLLSAGTHPDFFILQPEEPGKAIKIAEIRRMIATFTQTSYRGGYKVLIISPANAMNTAAANALLKTLEEPGKNTLIILSCSKPNLLPATIRSRCQQMHVQTPSYDVAKHWLEQQQVENSEILLGITHGSPLSALELSQGELLEQRETVFKALISIKQQALDPIRAAQTCTDINLLLLIDWLLSWCQDLLYLNCLNQHQINNKDYAQNLLEFAQSINSLKLYYYLDRLMELKRVLQRTINLNKQLCLEDIFCTWSNLK